MLHLTVFSEKMAATMAMIAITYIRYWPVMAINVDITAIMTGTHSSSKYLSSLTYDSGEKY
jgi:hypothetical protein